MRLEDRTLIVTGGASGIGKAIAVKAAAEGASVIVADIREDPREGGENTIDVITTAGGEAEFMPVDITRWDEVDRMVSDTVLRRGRLDVMVNNAAAHGRSALLDTTEEEWEEVMAVGAKGMFFGCKRAIQQMITQDPRPGSEARGRIVNISSQHGMIGSPNDFAYGVSKSCAVYMTRQIAGDYAKALSYQDRLMPLHEAIFLEPGVAGAKYALSQLGKCGEEIRLPLTPVGDLTRKAIDAALRHAGLMN